MPELLKTGTNWHFLRKSGKSHDSHPPLALWLDIRVWREEQGQVHSVKLSNERAAKEWTPWISVFSIPSHYVSALLSQGL